MSVTFPYSFGIHHAEVRIEEVEQGLFEFQLTFTDGNADNFRYSLTEGAVNEHLELDKNEARKEAIDSFHILLTKAGE